MLWSNFRCNPSLDIVPPANPNGDGEEPDSVMNKDIYELKKDTFYFYPFNLAAMSTLNFKGMNSSSFVKLSSDGKVVKFGAFGYDDYTQTGDKKQKRNYLARHRKREDWTDPQTPGALSRWILWNKPSLDESIEHYVKKFRMHLE
jgi:hypothetical protein